MRTWIDANQGETSHGRAFGFIGTEETYLDDEDNEVTYCGWFFEWPSSRAVVVTTRERDVVMDSLTLDETERHREAIPYDVAAAQLSRLLEARSEIVEED